jgi:uncharacterized protein (DUF2141 family)
MSARVQGWGGYYLHHESHEGSPKVPSCAFVSFVVKLGMAGTGTGASNNLLNRSVGVFLMLASFALAQTPPENLIRVEIAGLRNDKGKVMCALFSSASDFPKHAGKAVMRTTVAIADRHAVCEFAGVTPGTYAVSTVHDEDSNGRLDTNFIGIPREGVGASNNAKGHFGPPKFDAASFRYSGGRLDLKVNIDYL